MTASFKTFDVVEWQYPLIVLRTNCVQIYELINRNDKNSSQEDSLMCNIWLALLDQKKKLLKKALQEHQRNEHTPPDFEISNPKKEWRSFVQNKTLDYSPKADGIQKQ